MSSICFSCQKQNKKYRKDYFTNNIYYSFLKNLSQNFTLSPLLIVIKIPK